MAEVALDRVGVRAAKPAAQKRTAPIVPERSVAGRTLVLLIAIMTFLSGVTLGGVVLVQKTAIAWSSDVGREVTIQIRPIEGEVMDSNIRTAISLAEATPGVTGAHAISLEDSEKLLEPWLGSGLDLAQLEIPRLIVVELGDPKSVDLSGRERDLKTIKGATRETHAAWRQQLNTMAATLVFSGVLVLLLIVLATVLAVVFATRGTMATTREIVDVLHFIGAGAAGSIMPDQASAQLGLLFGRFSLGIDGIVGIAAVIPVLAALTAITSRLTVRRFLSQTSGLCSCPAAGSFGAKPEQPA